MKCGLVSVSFRSNSPYEIITAMRHAGLSCIEWGSDIHAPCDDTERLDSLRTLCRDNGISVSSYGTYFRIGQNKPGELETYIKAADRLGTDVLRLWCGDKPYRAYAQDEFSRLVEECHSLEKTARKAGVQLCMECHNGTVTETIDGALRLMDSVNSPFFSMYWQPNQNHTVSENLQYAKAAAPFIKHIHVFNWHDGGRYPLSEAENIWKQYLNEIGGDHTLLLEFMPDDRIETLDREAQSLCRLTEVSE